MKVNFNEKFFKFILFLIKYDIVFLLYIFLNFFSFSIFRNFLLFFFFILLVYFTNKYINFSNLFIFTIFIINLYKLNYFFNSQYILFIFFIIILFINFLDAILHFNILKKYFFFIQFIAEIAFVLIFNFFIIRYYETNFLNFYYFPIINIYEILVFFIFILFLFYIFFLKKYKKFVLLRLLILFVINIFFIILFFLIIFKNYQFIHQINPVLNNFLAKIHVPLMIFSYCGFFISSIFSSIFIFKKYFNFKYIIFNMLEKIIYNLILLSFSLFSLGNIVGSFWAKLSWGNYWNYDPKEMWSLILWINYLMILHFYLKYNHKKFIYFWIFFSLLLVVFVFFGINYFYLSLHSYF